jgi:cell division protein FtsB
VSIRALATRALNDEMLRLRLRDRRRFIEACCKRLKCDETDLYGKADILVQQSEAADEEFNKLDDENEKLKTRVKELEQEVADLKHLNDLGHADIADLEGEVAKHAKGRQELLEEAAREIQYERP